MTREVRYDHDTGRFLDQPGIGTPPPPGWIEAKMAEIEALPVAIRVYVGPGYTLCPDCAEKEDAESYEIEEDGTFGVRSCEWCDKEVRAK